jgi:hypothetical protein
MIIAVSAVRMVQMTIDQVINMVAVRHGLVAAVGAVSVMGFATVVRRAFLRIRGGYLNLMVVHMIAMSEMQMAIVEIVGVAVVFHGSVAAVWAMHMVVSPRVFLVSVGHLSQSFRNGLSSSRRLQSEGGTNGDELVRFHAAWVDSLNDLRG